MKGIKLTEEHKSKLLEMCKELFKQESEINSIQNFRIENNYILGLSDHLLYCENRDLSENQYNCEQVPDNELFTFENYPIESFEINIHWFEFCSTILLKKLSYELFKQNIEVKTWRSDTLWLEYNHIVSDCKKRNIRHPVDYLYQEFKKMN